MRSRPSGTRVGGTRLSIAPSVLVTVLALPARADDLDTIRTRVLDSYTAASAPAGDKGVEAVQKSIVQKAQSLERVSKPPVAVRVSVSVADPAAGSGTLTLTLSGSFDDGVAGDPGITVDAAQGELVVDRTDGLTHTAKLSRKGTVPSNPAAGADGGTAPPDAGVGATPVPLRRRPRGPTTAAAVAVGPRRPEAAHPPCCCCCWPGGCTCDAEAEPFSCS